ncbi:MAG: PQQ-like beta-propeller repeat protein, partial [Planctomycetes bacterium]|nr:PQQ-like beta-propeller repeat protein [Planctomycetota bacterium]
MHHVALHLCWFALLVAFAGCKAAPVMPDAWVGFRGGPTHPGSAAGARPIQAPQQVWEFDTGGTIESSPTVVDGVVYCGTFANHLYAIDAETGRERWRFRVDGLVRCSPAVADGVVYFGADDDRFYALDAATGEERWFV